MASTYFVLKKLKKKRMARKLRWVSEEQGNDDEKSAGLILEDLLKCRVCLKEATIPIYGDGHHTDFSEDLRLFGDVEITKDDDYPKHLCETCFGLLQGAVLFRKTAKETEEILLNFKSIDLPPRINTEEVDENFNAEDINQNDDIEIAIQSAKTLYCKLCKKNFTSNEEYARHRSSKEHKNVRIQCSICNRLLTAQLYKKHLLRHQTASHLICEVCGKLYRKDNLIRHLQLHSFDLPFQCQQCPYRGRFMESLRIHMRTHTGDKPFSCDKCQLRFLTRSNLNRHLLTHRKDRPFKCPECGRGFYTKCDVDIHFKSDHVGIKDFCCGMCGSKYGTRKALMRHELRVHKRDKMAKGRVPLYLQTEYRRESEDIMQVS